MFTIEKRLERNTEVLICRGEAEGRTMEVWIAPSLGMNTVRVIVNGQACIDWDLPRFEHGGTYGIPVLYPTPNVLPEGRYTFEGKNYQMVLNGQVCTGHGCVRLYPFELLRADALENEAIVEGVLKFIPGTPIYEAFPFASELKVKITVTLNTWRFDYEVKNTDEKNLPFGLTLHTFFQKTGQKTLARCTGASNILAMCEDGDPYPITGRKRSSIGTFEDISHWFNPTDYKTRRGICYYGFDPKDSGEVWYKDTTGLHVEMDCSGEFKYMVFYAPKGFDYFAMENQTCSADPMNTYERGLKEESNLMIVKPGEAHKGYVVYTFSFLAE